MLKHYVAFLYPGSFFPEEKSKEIKSRDEKIEIPDGCFAYYFWDREEVLMGKELLVGKEKNRSGRFYLGETLTLEEIEKSPGCEILASNMRVNAWPVVVKTRMGNYQPVLENDVVLDLKKR